MSPVIAHKRQRRAIAVGLAPKLLFRDLIDPDAVPGDVRRRFLGIAVGEDRGAIALAPVAELPARVGGGGGEVGVRAVVELDVHAGQGHVARAAVPGAGRAGEVHVLEDDTRDRARRGAQRMERGDLRPGERPTA